MSYFRFLSCLYAVGAVITFWFLARYSLKARWQDTSVGRQMWFASFLNWEIFTVLAWSAYVGPSKLPFQRGIQTAFVVQFIAMVAWRAILFEVEQRRGRRARASAVNRGMIHEDS